SENLHARWNSMALPDNGDYASPALLSPAFSDQCACRAGCCVAEKKRTAGCVCAIAAINGKGAIADVIGVALHRSPECATHSSAVDREVAGAGDRLGRENRHRASTCAGRSPAVERNATKAGGRHGTVVDSAAGGAARGATVHGQIAIHVDSRLDETHLSSVGAFSRAAVNDVITGHRYR